MKPNRSLLLLLFFFLLIFSCKKNSQSPSSKSVYLVKQIIEEFPQLNGQRDTLQYNYDNNNNLTDYGSIYKGKYVLQRKFLYNADNQVGEVDDYNYSTSDTLTNKFLLTYTNGSFTIDFYNSKEKQMGHGLVTLNAKKQVARYDDETYYMLLDYDNRGNLIFDKAYPQPGWPPVSETGTMTYDDYKNPFSALQGNYFFMLYTFTFQPSTFVNNISFSGGPIYQYNSDGYPTKVNGNYDGEEYIDYYIYTIK
jgi:hypothetical protein